MARQQAVTAKALVTGSILAFLIGAGVPASNIVINGSLMAHNFSTPAALFLFLILVLFVNSLLGRFVKPLALGRQELAVVYVMAMLATSIPTVGFVENLLPILAGLYYYATPENDWETLIHPHVPEWLAPQDALAVRYFYEGLPAGASVPWGAWVEPLIYWCLFMCSMYWVFICAMVILRRQWVENEKLIYPLVQLPLGMIADDSRGSLIKPFFRNWAMWAGFAIPFAIGCINGLHSYYEFLPKVVQFTDMRLFRETTYLRIDLNLALLGFAYLINRDMALGFWLFFLLTTLQKGLFGVLGIYSSENLSRFANNVGPYLAHQAMGAMIVLVLAFLWMSRGHLRAVYRKAVSGQGAHDSGEVLSYRTACLGLLGGLLFVCGWLWRSGFPIWVIPVFLFALLVIFLAVTRAVVEGGVSFIRSPLTPADFVISGLGTPALGASGLIGVAFTYVWAANIRIFFLACFANALRVVEEIQGSRRRVIWAVALAVVIALASSIWAVMELSYIHGGINLHRFWFIFVPQTAFGYIAPKFATPVPANVGGWGFTGLGAALMLVLTWCRYRFVWWPVHPLGFATGTFHIMNWVWFSVFLAWLLKSMILRYSGASGYHRTRPFFLGLILGHTSVAGVWLIVDYFTGMNGNVVGFF